MPGLTRWKIVCLTQTRWRTSRCQTSCQSSSRLSRSRCQIPDARCQTSPVMTLLAELVPAVAHCLRELRVANDCNVLTSFELRGCWAWLSTRRRAWRTPRISLCPCSETCFQLSYSLGRANRLFLILFLSLFLSNLQLRRVQPSSKEHQCVQACDHARQQEDAAHHAGPARLRLRAAS